MDDFFSILGHHFLWLSARLWMDDFFKGRISDHFSVAFDEALEGRFFQGQQVSGIVFCDFP